MTTLTKVAWRRSQSLYAYGHATAVHLTVDGERTLCGISIPEHARPGFKFIGPWFEQHATPLDPAEPEDFDETDGTNSHRECKRCASRAH